MHDHPVVVFKVLAHHDPLLKSADFSAERCTTIYGKLRACRLRVTQALGPISVWYCCASFIEDHGSSEQTCKHKMGWRIMS